MRVLELISELRTELDNIESPDAPTAIECARIADKALRVMHLHPDWREMIGDPELSGLKAELFGFILMKLFRIHYTVAGTPPISGHLDRNASTPAQAQAEALRTLSAIYAGQVLIRKVKRLKEQADA